MASTISQLGVLATGVGRPEDGVPHNLQSLAIRVEIGSGEIPIDLHWLSRQRDALGDGRFREILSEHLDDESVPVVLDMLRHYEEADDGDGGAKNGGTAARE